MDQLKEFFGLFKRQHFWFILPTLLITSLLGWFLASGKIAEAVSSQHQAIKGQIAKAKGVSKIQDHPNTKFHEGQEELNKARMKNVKDAWEKKWNRQADILVWPEGNWSFREKVKGLRHIESIDVKTVGITNFDLSQFKKYVKEELPKLAAKVDAHWDPQGKSRSRSGGEGEELSAEERAAESYIVDWEKESQVDIDLNFDWGTGFPNTLEMFYAQEDLWVLSALMDIIAKTNEGARTRATAAVKKIISIQFGQSVTEQKYRVVRPIPPATGTDVDDPMAVAVAPEPEPEVTGGGDDEDKAKLPHPALNRYVDNKFKPIEQVSTDVLGVAKRIPVRIRLEMDQRQINNFLAACANSPLTFEVHQQRFNPKTGNFGRRSRSVEQRHDEGPVSLRRERSNTLKKLGDVSTFDRVVEFYGIIYIFNPVNQTLIGGEGEAPLET